MMLFLAALTKLAVSTSALITLFLPTSQWHLNEGWVYGDLL